MENLVYSVLGIYFLDSTTMKTENKPPIIVRNNTLDVHGLWDEKGATCVCLTDQCLWVWSSFIKCHCGSYHRWKGQKNLCPMLYTSCCKCLNLQGVKSLKNFVDYLDLHTWLTHWSTYTSAFRLKCTAFTVTSPEQARGRHFCKTLKIYFHFFDHFPNVAA